MLRCFLQLLAGLVASVHEQWQMHTEHKEQGQSVITLFPTLFLSLQPDNIPITIF